MRRTKQRKRTSWARSLLFALVKITALPAILWTLWWHALASGRELAVEKWLDAQGWRAEYESAETSGFPWRVDDRIRGLELIGPKNRRSWSLPEIRFESEAIGPTTVAMRLFGPQRLSLFGEGIEFSHERMTADLSLAPGPALGLRRGAAAASDLILKVGSSWIGAVKTLTAEIERAPTGAPPNGYEVDLSLTGLAIPESLLRRADPGGFLGASVEKIRLAGTVTFRAPLNRFALAEKPAFKSATLRNAELIWGGLKATASGRIRVDAQGYAAGRIDLELREWRKTMAVLHRSGAFGRSRIDAMTEALAIVSNLTGKGADLAIPLTLTGGKIKVGPFTVGNAPRLAPPRR